MRGSARSITGLALLASIAACGGASSSTEPPPSAPRRSALAALGELLYHAAVNSGEVPYMPPATDGGQSPTLWSDEIDAVLAFLCTLTDGVDPEHPEAYARPTQCTDIASAAASRLPTVSAH